MPVDPLTLARAKKVVEFLNVNKEKILGGFRVGYGRVNSAKKELLGQTNYAVSRKEIEEIVELAKKYKEFNDLIFSNPQLLNYPEIKEFIEKNKLTDLFNYLNPFLTNQTPVVYDPETKRYLFLTPDLNKAVLFKAKEEKSTEPQKKINIVSFDKRDNFEEITAEREVPKEFFDITQYLNDDYKSLLALSIYVEELYALHRAEEAEKIKWDSISTKYKSEGLKFCNLYDRGYLKSFFANLCKREGLNKSIVSKEIFEFIRNADSIFFVNQYMDEDKLSVLLQDIADSFMKKRNYIAVHGLGRASQVTTSLVNKIEKMANLDASKYAIKTINSKEPGKPWEFSQIWFTDSGKSVYDLIKD